MADQDDDLDLDDSAADTSDSSDAADARPVGTSAMKLSPQPAPMNPVLQSYLQNKQQMADAQKQASHNEMLTGLARAGASLSAGLAHASQPVNQAPFDAMAANDQAPVTNVVTAQKSQAQDLSNQAAAMDTTKKMGDEDPESPQSVAAKNLIKKLYPGKFEDSALEGLSAADIGNSIMKPLELDQKINEHKDEMQQRGLDRNALNSSKKSAKDEADHEKYVQHVEDNEKSWRSDPASTRYDAMLSASTTGKAMIDKYRGREDEMPIQDIHALVSDRLKAITGATPTEAEIDAQMPHTLKSKFGSVKSWITGSPEPAGAGDFVKNIDSSFQEMEKTAMAGLKHRQETVASSPRLTKDDHDRLVSIGVPEPAYGQTSAQYSPDVLNYAKTHNLTPDQAQKIKDQRTQKFAFGGVVQPPGFQHVRQPAAPHLAAPKAIHMPKAPVVQMPAADKPMTAPMRFDKGGQVPGKPPFPGNDPRNDVVDAKLTPSEIVLPPSVTGSKDPAMAAYLFVKRQLGAK